MQREYLEDETIQSLVQLKDLRFVTDEQGNKKEDRQREKEKEAVEISTARQPETTPSPTENASSTTAGADGIVPPSAVLPEEEEFRPLRSIAAITNEERRKRSERLKIEGKGRKHESDSDFEIDESEEVEDEEEEESEDASDFEYSEGEGSKGSGGGGNKPPRRDAYDKETLFYIKGIRGERNSGSNPDYNSDGGEGGSSLMLKEGLRSGGLSASTGGRLDKSSAAGKRKYNRFNRRNLSFDDRCQQLLEFKHIYGHCHVKRTHPGETKGLAYWVERQRMAWRKGTLELDKKKRLDDIGFVWEAGTNGSGSEELREFEHQHAINNGRNKPEFASSAEYGSQTSVNATDAGEGGPSRDLPDGDQGPTAGGGDIEREPTEVVPREEPRERIRDDTVTRRGRLKLEEAKSFDDWCALLQQFKDKHGHCDVKRRYFGKNKGLAYWAERQRASRRKGSLEEEKIARLDSMGFVWGNNEGAAAPHKRSGTNDSMDYSYGTACTHQPPIGRKGRHVGLTYGRAAVGGGLPSEASADGEVEETASPRVAREATAPVSANATSNVPRQATGGPPRAAATGEDARGLDAMKTLEWEKMRREKEQLEQLKRKLGEEERKSRNREKKVREEKREWEEESINLQLENCLLKEKLLTLDEELKTRGTPTYGTSAKRKRDEVEADEDGLGSSAVVDEKDPPLPEKRRKTGSPLQEDSVDDDKTASMDDHNKPTSLLPPAPARPVVKAPVHPLIRRTTSSTEPTDLYALLCAIEGHLRSLVQGQKSLSTHQRAILDLSVANADNAAAAAVVKQVAGVDGPAQKTPAITEAEAAVDKNDTKESKEGEVMEDDDEEPAAECKEKEAEAGMTEN